MHKLALPFAAIFLFPSLSPALTIGSFDTSRAGQFSLHSSSRLSNFRNSITSTFAGVTLSSAPSLTPAYLSTLDLLFLTSPTGDVSAISPLTPAEQSALTWFVQSGRGVVICSDNDTFAGGNSQPANDSLLAPFGLHSTGTFHNAQTVNMTPAPNPLASGPAGNVTSYTAWWVAYYNTLPPGAVVAARLAANNQPALVYLPDGAFSPNSGPVVFCSDASLLVNDLAAPAAFNMLLNSLSYATPAHTFLPGDANLNGIIDPDDLSLTDKGDALNLSGWSNGDFNGDNQINSADYTLLHQSLSAQGGFSPSTLTAIPEPTTLSLLTLTSLFTLRRRPTTRED